MILQTLKEYYEQKQVTLGSDAVPEGFERMEIPFIVLIDKDGTFCSLNDTRVFQGDKLIAKKYLLPRRKGRSGVKSYKTTFLLWDHIGYLFQYPESDGKTPKQHKTWKESLENLPDNLKNDEGVSAILKFYQNQSSIELLKQSPLWVECTKIPSCFMTFQLVSDSHPIPCRSSVQDFVKRSVSQEQDPSDDTNNTLLRCLVTGEKGIIASSHGQIKLGKESARLVSFQKNSGYDSYGKEQGYNAPVCKYAEFAYTTALNTLIKSDHTKISVGDISIVFWATRENTLENVVSDFFIEPPSEDPDRLVRSVSSLYESIRSGVFPDDQGKTKFCILGLSPNKARIAIRFWIVSTVKEMSGKIYRHFDDTRIISSPFEKKALSLKALLSATAKETKFDKNKKNLIQYDGKWFDVNPSLVGSIVRAIFEEVPYPIVLLQTIIGRIRSEQSKKNRKTGRPVPHVTYERAALIKAYLNRSISVTNPRQERKLDVSLDHENTNIGYRLGRLFAALERVQTQVATQKGGRELNTTIRDRYYGAASGTPCTVFPTLCRLNKHHLSKIEGIGERKNLEKLFCEIMNEIPSSGFPPCLDLADQGRFAIGYYHQMQDFFTKKSDKSE